MRNHRGFVNVKIIFLLIMICVGVSQAGLVGYTAASSDNSVVYLVNFETGEQAPIGQPSGIWYLGSLDTSPIDGQIYALSGDSAFYKVDPTTGIGTLIRDNIYTTAGGYQRLSFAPDGTLYGILNFELWKLNASTGDKTYVGSLIPDVPYSSAFAINDQGEGIVFDISLQTLFEIDLTDGSVSSIGYLSGNFQAFDYGQDGILYARDSSILYSINTENLTKTSIMSLPHGFSLAVIPEPATLLLFGLGGLILRRLKFKS